VSRRLRFFAAAALLGFVASLTAFTGSATAARVVGTSGADLLRGTTKRDVIQGKGGNDRLRGLAGNDVLNGGGGRDVLLGGAGDDRLEARDGSQDRLTCGSGRDVAIVDPADKAGPDCEVVRRPRASPPSPPPPPPSPPPPPAPELGSQANPVPIGVAAALFDGWELTVLSVTPNADAQVLAADGFNDPPEPGKQYFIATVKVTRTGAGAERFFASVRFRALGPSGVLLASYSASNACGVVPDEVPFGPVATGASIGGNVCWEAPSAEVGALVMFDDYASDKTKRVWFALTR
jgi:hypothetical protein